MIHLSVQYFTFCWLLIQKSSTIPDSYATNMRQKDEKTDKKFGVNMYMFLLLLSTFA